MTAAVDASAYGSRFPNALDRAVIALTRKMPANWLGLRLAILLRRIVTMRLGAGGIDTMLWGLRLRLYPLGNGCEKNALFTPQMYDTLERAVLADAVDCALERRTFTFVDIGANVGLYSLFVAAHAGDRARILAIEPQPGILDRLLFNLRANPQVSIDVLPIALADRDGEIELVIDPSDSGGTHVAKDSVASGEVVRVRCRPLADVLAEAGIASIDALKIDVESAEDLVLGPFLEQAPASLLPRWILIEDTRDRWRLDLFALAARRGYREHSRSRKHNVVLHRP